MECQIAITQGIKGNVWHPVTHIWEYLNLDLDINDIIQYYVT